MRFVHAIAGAAALLILLVASAMADAASWPLAPTDRPHGVYGTFLNPGVAYVPGFAVYRQQARILESGDFAGYHLGVDIAVNDSVPHPDAPPGTTHGVYAIEDGTVTTSESPDGGQLPAEGCYTTRNPKAPAGMWPWRVVVGRYIYGHIRPAVELGQAVTAGQLIGWTCAGAWHVHVGERQGPGFTGRYLNPLRPDGPLAAPDTAPPRVARYAFSEPRTRIRGLFSASVLVGDRWPYVDWEGAPVAGLHPWHLRFVVKRAGRIVSKRNWYARTTPRPLREHYNISLAMRNMPVKECAEKTYGDLSCQPALWVRAYTGRLRPGAYRLLTIAWDAAGNRAERTVSFRVG